MSFPAWQVITWTRVCTRLDDWGRLAARFKHIGTSLEVQQGQEGLMRGQVLWGVMCGDERLGVAWDWKEIRPNVVVLADPMSILSNLEFSLDDGVLLDENDRVVELNDAIHDLPWQRKVCAAARRDAVVRSGRKPTRTGAFAAASA